MAEARRKAHEAHNAAELREQTFRWRESQEINAYCQILAERIDREPPDTPGVPEAREWLSWPPREGRSAFELRRGPLEGGPASRTCRRGPGFAGQSPPAPHATFSSATCNDSSFAREPSSKPGWWGALPVDLPARRPGGIRTDMPTHGPTSSSLPGLNLP